MGDQEYSYDPEPGTLPAVRSQSPANVIDAKDGSIVGTDALIYAGASMAAITTDESAKLTAKSNPNDLDILPTGEVYLSHVHVRRRLNDTFGVGSWALRPLQPPSLNGRTIIWMLGLYVRGSFMGAAFGEAEYYESNDRMSYATAAEAAKSNALTRCCKDLGIGWECWDRHFSDRWRAENCLKVFRKDKNGKTRAEWRRRDAQPFWDETGACPGQTADAPAPPMQQPRRASETARPTPPPTPQASTDQTQPTEAELAELERRAAEGQPDWSLPGWRQITILAYTARAVGKSSNTRHSIMFKSQQGDDIEASTFSASNGKALEMAKASGQSIWVRFKQNGNWTNVEEVFDGNRA